MTAPTPVSPPTARPSALLLGGILLLAAGLRAAALPAEPWFDEVWSWELARDVKTPWGVVFIRHDNSHPLNTLYLRACPSGLPWACYRLHSLLAGGGGGAGAAWLGARPRPGEAAADRPLFGTRLCRECAPGLW